MSGKVNSAIFKAYDIRAVYPEDINEYTAYLVGRAFVKRMKCGTVVVGRDMRRSSPSLFKALSAGIVAEGANVIDVGVIPTPMLSFSVASYGYECGIVISASHNPGNYNAFKLIGPRGVQISGDTGIFDIRDLVLELEEEGTDVYDESKADELMSKNLADGRIIKRDAMEDYITHHVKYLNIENKDRKIKVVCDYGNGMGGVTALPFFEKTDLEVIHMYEEPDGEFPNHPSNPMQFETLEDIRKKIVEEKADIGFAFDGDADRCLVIDEKGEIIMPDLCLALLAEEELKEFPGEKVYYDLRFSKIVKEEIENYGGVPVMMKVGNPFYKEKLINEGGVVAGELSGHIMFKENFGIDDGLFAALKFLNILGKTENADKTVSELIKPLRKYFGSPEINNRVEDATETLAKVKAAFADGKHVDIDGVHVTYEDWWFSLRMSNTEPVVRLRLEADTAELLEEKKEKVLSYIDAL